MCYDNVHIKWIYKSSLKIAQILFSWRFHLVKTSSFWGLPPPDPCLSFKTLIWYVLWYYNVCVKWKHESSLKIAQILFSCFHLQKTSSFWGLGPQTPACHLTQVFDICHYNVHVKWKHESSLKIAQILFSWCFHFTQNNQLLGAAAPNPHMSFNSYLMCCFNVRKEPENITSSIQLMFPFSQNLQLLGATALRPPPVI